RPRARARRARAPAPPRRRSGEGRGAAMKRVQLDKIASVTLRLELDRNAVLGDEIPAQAGTVVAGRVLNAKTSYNTLEDVHGRMVALHPGDVIAGALGHRDALYGFSGHVPDK